MAAAKAQPVGGSQIRRRRNAFRLHEAPKEPMCKVGFPTGAVGQRSVSSDLEVFARWFEDQPNARERFRWVLRDSLDELLDGQRTGKWHYKHLSKTEKTALGTRVEVNLTKEFNIADGAEVDWNIGGLEIDCKFSKDYTGWEIPMEMYLCRDHGEQSGVANQAALLVWMSDDTRQWAAGLVRMTDDRLRWKDDKTTGKRVRSYNRDNKRKLGDTGLDEVYWMWGGVQGDLPENTILRMSVETRDAVFGKRTGQQRVNELLRHCAQVLLTRSTILTVAQQDDGMKRARDARLPRNLGNEGFLVLGHQEASPHIAKALGMPVPQKGEVLSLRVTPCDERDSCAKVFIDGAWWTTATGGASRAPAPTLPKKKPSQGWDAYLKAC